jgi:transcription elongation factor Elf1
MGRRRRKVVRVVKRTIPKIFSCPSCGEESVRVELQRGNKLAVVQCSECGLKGEFDVSPADQIVDIYCKFTDKFYSGSGGAQAATPVVKKAPEPPVGETETDDDEGLESKDEKSSSEDAEESGFDTPIEEDTPVDETEEAVEEETEDVEEGEIQSDSVD